MFYSFNDLDNLFNQNNSENKDIEEEYPLLKKIYYTIMFVYIVFLIYFNH